MIVHLLSKFVQPQTSFNDNLENLSTVLDCAYISNSINFNSVAEPPLFWAAPAPAPGRQGPGADSGSGSDLLGSAPAPQH